MSWDFGGGLPADDARSGAQVQEPWTGEVVDDQASRPTGAEPTSGPLPLLGAGVLMALGAAAFAAWHLWGPSGARSIGEHVWGPAAAWFVGGPVAIGLLALFVKIDTARQAGPWYAVSPWSSWGRRLLVVVCLVAVALNAWIIADHFARGGRF